MKAPRAFLFDFQLTKDMEVYKKNEGSQEYILFSARSFDAQRNGMYFNALFQCYGDVKARVERMKLRRGSVVDIIAEMTQYKKDNSYETAYRVIDIVFSEKTAPKNEEQTTTNTTIPAEKSFIENMHDIFLPKN